MSVDAHTARDDLAFLRALAEAGDDGQRQFGRVYLAAGLIYGAQMLAHAAQALGWIATPSWPISPWSRWSAMSPGASTA